MVNFNKNALIALACLGTSATAQKTAKVTFNVVDPEGTIASSKIVQQTRGLKEAKGSKGDTKSPTTSPVPSTSPAPSAIPSACMNVPAYENVMGQTCEAFEFDQNLCDTHNIPDFDRVFPTDACCVCGGSALIEPWEKPESCNTKSPKSQPVPVTWTDMKGNTCDWYDYVYPALCGAAAADLAKPGELSANEVCCRCRVNDSSDSPSVSLSPSINPSVSSFPSEQPSSIEKSVSIGSITNASEQYFFVKLFEGSLPTMLRLGKHIDFIGDLNSIFEYLTVEFPDNCSNIQQKVITVGSGTNDSNYGWVTDIVPDGWKLVDVVDCLSTTSPGGGIWGINIVVSPSANVDYSPNGQPFWWQIRFNIVDVVVEN